MRTLVVFLILFLLMSFGCQPAEEPAPEPAEDAAPASMNAVDVDPSTTSVEFENDWVRVIRSNAPAGHTSGSHVHEAGVFVSVSDYAQTTTYADGEVQEAAGSAGETGSMFDMAGREHVTENTGEAESEAIIVELKVDGGAPAEAPSADAVEVDSEHHVVEFENDLVRVVRMTYPEGYATPPHNHYPGVNVVLTDVAATSGPEGEELEPTENAAGAVAWADGGEPHVTTNLGGEISLVRVELKVQ